MEIPEGLHVRYQHVRVFVNEKITPRGGYTIAYIEDADHNMIVKGVAKCRYDEQFNKRIGRDVSRGRALKRLKDHKWWPAEGTPLG
jgi:hypothetical protein